MTVSPTQSFDQHVFSCPIHGWNLVEASAGTGKTYQIQTLYARLILEKGWNVESVLVVTFTEAATQELRQRLQTILTKVSLVLAGGALPEGDADLPRILRLCDQAVAVLVDSGRELEQARLICRYRAQLACADFDRASIFTIHGFCARVLSECAFECGLDFDAELVGSNQALIEEVVKDVYRQQILPLPPVTAALLQENSLTNWIALVRALLGKPGAEIMPSASEPEPASCEMVCTELRQEAQRLAPVFAAEVADAVANEVFDQQRAHELHRLYSELSTDKALKAAGMFKHSAINKGVSWQPPLPPAVVSFGQLCSALIQRYCQLTGKKQVPQKTSWPQTLQDAQADQWFAELSALHQEQSTELQLLFDKDSAQNIFGKKVYSKVPELAELFCQGPDAIQAGFGLLSDFIESKLLVGRLKAKQWIQAAELRQFIDRCEQLPSVLQTWGLWFKRQFVEVCRQQLEQYKRCHNVMTYDDLLLRLHEALHGEAAGVGLLKAAIRSRYCIAIVDEFQDTDPVQFEIFHQAFHQQNLPVFVVGDPKQAIYGFRSGDVHTYFRARHLADNQYSLLTNWRSDARMVEAVNQLFAEMPGSDYCSFATEKISFEPAAPAPNAAPGAEQPLIIDIITVEPAPNKEVGSVLIANLTAQRIAEKIAAAVAPRDIAVLVQKHAEARLMKLALAEHGVAAVLQSAGKVFDSGEAKDLALVLTAMLEPANLSAICAALATPLFAVPALELAGGGDGQLPTRLQHYAKTFAAAHQRWRRHGFLVGFNDIVHALGIRQHLLSCRDGERSLTNLIHVAELLDRTARDNKLGMHATLQWLNRQLDRNRRSDADEYEIRLESDADAVSIMTVFKSKGLQFPYVFAPFMWSKTPTLTGKEKILIYHDANRDNRLILDMDPNALLSPACAEPPLPSARHEHEALAEQLRLLYVTVTRAEKQTYVVAGTLGTDQCHALHYLLYYGLAGVEPPPPPPLASAMPKKSNELPGLIAAADCQQRFPNIGLPTPAANDRQPRQMPAATTLEPSSAALSCHCRTLRHGVDKSWQVLSFSKLAHDSISLAASGFTAEALRDYDDESEIAEAAQLQARAVLAANPDSLFSFPAGKKTGNCWHAIFENLDFTAPPAQRQQVVDEWAARFRLLPTPAAGQGAADGEISGFAQRQAATLNLMVDTVLQMPLPGCSRRLGQISSSDRLTELQFDFPVAATGVSRARLAEALLAVPAWQGIEPFTAILSQWCDPQHADNTRHGFMTGFIDLVFRDEHNGRYYLLDWKSNKLDGTAAAFNPDGLRLEMARNCYFLQYLLYTVALHQYLQANLAGYDYQTNFGGAYYIFLRGILPPPDSTRPWDPAEHAVFYDRPPLATVEALSAVLTVERKNCFRPITAKHTCFQHQTSM